MKVGIIGQGATGVTLAIMLKMEDPSIDVTIFDKEDKANKKLAATGNGRCNLGNMKLVDNAYNNEFALNLYKSFPIEEQRKFFDSIGLMTREINGLVYPFSLRAPQVVDYLNSLMKHYKVKCINDVKLVSYTTSESNVEVVMDNQKIYKFDYLVLACGGKSHSTLGSDGSIFKILNKHKYELRNLYAGLTPVKVSENVKGIENEKVKGVVKLYLDKNLAYEEEGEILFKRNGLSGIAIMNASSIIKRNKAAKKTRISIDLFKDKTVDDLIEIFKKYGDFADFSFLNGLFSKKLADFIRVNSGAKNLYKFDNYDIVKIANYLKNMEFTYVDNYGFDDSQVTIGGISVNNVNESLASTIENRVYLGGEMLDIDGLCGGYNLMLAFASAKKIKDDLLTK